MGSFLRPAAMLGGGLVMLAAVAAQAQDSSEPTGTTTQDHTSRPAITLPVIEIEGDPVGSSAQRAIIRKREAPNAITVIESEQLNQFGDQPLGDALRRLPGVTFPGGNRARDLQLRAIGAEYTQVLVNGRALIDGSSRRSVQVDRIPSSLVERVEIIRSPLASQDGQGAAGTINIVLKNANAEPRTELGLGGGYLEENGAIGDATALQAGEFGMFRYVLSGGVQRQRRNESKDIFAFDGNGDPDGGELGINERKFNQLNLIPAFEFQPSDRDVLRLEPSYLYTKEFRFDQSKELNADQVTLRRTEVEDRERVRENFGIHASWTHDISTSTTAYFSFDAQHAREDTERDATRFLPDGTIDRRRQRTEDIDLRRFSPKALVTHALDDHSLSWGGDYSYATREEDNSQITNGVVNTPNATRVYEVQETRWNGFVQDIWQLDEDTRLTGGVRLERSATRTEDADGISNTERALFVLPSLHAVHSVLPQTDLRAGVARTLRRPDLRELTPTVQTQGGTLSSPDTGGNPNLVPEAIWGLDAGIDQFFYDNLGLISLNLFARQFNDKIESVSQLENGRFVSRPQNTGDGYLYGVELEGRMPLAMVGLPDLALWGNVTHTHTKVDTPTGDSRRFLDHHDAVANVGLDWYVAPWRTTFGASANWVSGYHQTVRASDGSFQKNNVDGTTRVDLSARTELADGLSLNLSVLNILANTERRTDKVFDNAGALSSRSVTTEDTYRAGYARLHWRF
ncbi:MAG: TonB-dependent receptor plug domain-containing protein [Kiloniellales bacterium]